MEWSTLGSEYGYWIPIAAIAVFLISFLAVPLILISLPVNYFSHTRREARSTMKYSAWQSILVIIKNLLGALFVIGGIMMLVLPGQGVLTIAAGLMMMNFPGKYRVERWLVGYAPVARSINWVRGCAHKPPMTF